jgi:mRNA (2'-O-methyladenosine-N6-)-methyltransferase
MSTSLCCTRPRPAKASEPYNMSSDELRSLSITALKSLFGSRKTYAPISSMVLLTRVIAFNPTAAQKARLRLTDLARFEDILNDISRTWDEGIISLTRDNGGLTILDFSFDSTVTECGVTSGSNPRKRKRVIDEDDDSAAGDAVDDTSVYESPGTPTASTLANLSKEMREAYSILQRGTAKRRLLAEQVYLFLCKLNTPSNFLAVSVYRGAF